MAMWRRCAPLKSASSYSLRECRKLVCFSCRSFSNATPVVRLHNSITNAELFLVGVAHACPKSAGFVQHMIRDFMPKVVAVELCKGRADFLLSCDHPRESATWKQFLSLKGGLRETILRFILSELCVRPDYTQTMHEMKVAIQEGLAIGANVVYMDQDKDVTVKRIAQEFSLMQVIWVILMRKGIYRQYPVLVKALDTGNNALMHPKVLEELVRFADKYLPGLARCLVHERNEYMVKNLRKMSGSIVGVVGAAHVQGMHKLWQEAEFSARHVQEMRTICQEAEV